MKIKFWMWAGIVVWLLFGFALVSGNAQERSNTHYAAEYKKATVGANIAAAQAECIDDAAVPCYIVIDAAMAKMAEGTLPAKCAQCQWQDFRSSNSVGGKPTPLQQGFVNVVTDCTVPTDRVSDSYAAWVTCAAANPGRKFLWPRLSGTSSPSNPDYVFNSQPTLQNMQWWGEGGRYFADGTVIKFAAGVKGPLVKNSELHEISIVGSEPAPSSSGETDKMIVPSGDNLEEYSQRPDYVLRSGGVVTLKWTNRWSWWQVNGQIKVSGMTNSTMNGTYYVDSAGYTSNYYYVTYAQAGAPDVGEVAGAAGAKVQPATTGTSTADGVTLAGSSVMRGVFVANFGRYCVNVDGTNYISDDWDIDGAWLYGCRAHGIKIRGGDSNAGTSHHIKAYFNQLYGSFDYSFLNTYQEGLQLSYNHTGGVQPAAGATKAISSISRASGVITGTTAVAHGFAVGHGIVLAGVSDSSFNSRAATVGCFVATVPDSTHFTCVQPGYNLADATSSGGTARLVSQAELFVGIAIDGGSFTAGRDSFAGTKTYLNPYVESGQDSANGNNSIRLNLTVSVYGLHSGDNVDPNWLPGVRIRGGVIDVSSSGLLVKGSGLSIQPCSTGFCVGAFNFFDSSSAIKWQTEYIPSGSTARYSIFNGTDPNNLRLNLGASASYGHVDLNGFTGGAWGVMINRTTGSGTGGLEVWSGGASPAKVAGIDANGKGVFNGGVAVESAGNITITSGTGVPSAGACTASTLGALYLNKSGGASTSLYVCTAAGVWTGK